MTVNVSNVGFGQSNVALYLNIQGPPGTPAVRVPVTRLTSGLNATTGMVVSSDTAVFTMPDGRGAGVGISVVIADQRSGTELQSNVVVDSYIAPYIAKVISVVKGIEFVTCPIFDPFLNTTVTTQAYFVSLSGSGFGAPSADGHSSLSSPGVFAEIVMNLTVPGTGLTFPLVVSCVEMWSDTAIQFAAAYSGTAAVRITSLDMNGIANVQMSNSESFSFDSPTVSALSVDGPGFSAQNNVPTDGETDA